MEMAVQALEGRRRTRKKSEFCLPCIRGFATDSCAPNVDLRVCSPISKDKCPEKRQCKILRGIHQLSVSVHLKSNSPEERRYKSQRIVHVSSGSTPPVVFTNDSRNVVSRITSNDNVVAKSTLLTGKRKGLVSGIPNLQLDLCSIIPRNDDCDDMVNVRAENIASCLK
ncbi:unnamed protein product [Amaranthus hypochondriacus]